MLCQLMHTRTLIARSMQKDIHITRESAQLICDVDAGALNCSKHI